MSKLLAILGKYKVVGDTTYGLSYEDANNLKADTKDLFKEIVNSSNQEFPGATGPVRVCPTSVLLEKIEEL